MRKKILIFICVLAGLIGFYKYKQHSFLGLSTSKIETVQSIEQYAQEHGIKGEIFVAKDKRSFSTLQKFFNYGDIYVLDSELNLIDCNNVSLGGRCFQDISDDICNDIDMPMREIKNITGKRVMDSLLTNSINVSRNEELQFNTYHRIYIYTWVKYAAASVSESSLQPFNHIAGLKNSKNLILTVNTDSLINFR